MSTTVQTLADVKNCGYSFRTAKDGLAQIVRKKVLAGEELFPDIFGIETAKRRFIEIMSAGRGGLLTGEYGVAKTDLAKHLVSLLNEYYISEPVFAVEQCPVQEDPHILLQYMNGSAATRLPYAVEPCPICKNLIKNACGDPEKITVRRLDRLVEGTGFARVQGGGDVLPEEIVGTYNLLKLAQIGDPFDPRVFEPGKIGQSSRGVLFVDEIGKLPENAQHALIQAAQESIVTPAKTRETFPVDFLLVATTNPVDEEYICGAVRDRLVSIKIPLVGLEEEIRIVQKEIEKDKSMIYVPGLFVKLAVEVVRALRGDERLEIGPRTSINAGLISRSSARLEDRGVVSYCNIKEGIYTAILGKALFEDTSDIEKKIDEVFPEISSYIEHNIDSIELPKITRYCRDFLGDADVFCASALKKIIQDTEEMQEIGKFSQWIYSQETIYKYRIYEVMAEYLEAYERGCVKGEKPL